MTKIGKRSVILLSGGLDSAANLALATLRDEPILALTARYGQRAAEREVRAARSLCQHFDVRHKVVSLEWLGALGGSALTGLEHSVPELAENELDAKAVTEVSARAVWVPNRNGVLINVAAAWAERLGAEQVIVGFNAEEAATFPDNTVDFLERATRALELSTANHVRLACYTAAWDKRRIVAELRANFSGMRAFPFEKVWSCYHGGETACGRCESCQRLKRAIESF